MQTKLQDIEIKIKELQEKKKQLEQKKLSDLARLIKRVEADLIPINVLVGGLLEIVNLVKHSDIKIKDLEKSGKAYLDTTLKRKEVENSTSSFQKNDE